MMKLSVRESFLALRQQLADQPRLRAGIWGVAGLIALQSIMMISDARQELLPEIQQLSDLYARQSIVLTQADWNERAVAARTRLEQINERIWKADSTSLARAEFQTWLEEQADAVDLPIQNLEMRVPIELETLSGYYRIAASIRTRHAPARVLRFVGALLDANQWVMIDGLVIDDQRQRSGQIELYSIYQVRDRSESQ